MKFDAHRFLEGYAETYNARDAKRLLALFALEDPRFSVFEEFTGNPLSGRLYGDILGTVKEATGTMSFDLLESTDFGAFALVHAIQKIVDGQAQEGFGEALIRVTLWIVIGPGGPRILAGHYSSMMLCFPKRPSVLPMRRRRDEPEQPKSATSG